MASIGEVAGSCQPSRRRSRSTANFTRSAPTPMGCPPGQLEQLLGRQDAPSVSDQSDEQRPVGGVRSTSTPSRVTMWACGGRCGAARRRTPRWSLRRSRTTQQRVHPGEELGVAERLGDVVVRPGTEALDLLLLVEAGGQHEDPDLGHLTDPTDQHEAVDVGQPEVDHHEVGAVLEQGPHSGLARGGTAIQPGPLEQRAQQAPDVRVVVDHQHQLRLVFMGSRLAPPRGRRTGGSIRNVAPGPSVGTTAREPPWSPMIERAIARPRPVPGTFWRIAADPRAKRPKICSSSPAPTPGPGRAPR